ncbi:MAG TPA: LEA type 2 family protein [Myxococcales bacterium]|nr:LEA type 2 family protein [Myxococcales bacterium]
MRRFITLSAALAACASAPQPKPPDTSDAVQAERLTVTDQTLTSFSVEAKLSITNPTQDTWTVTGASDELWVDGTQAATDNPSVSQTIAPGGTGEVTIPASAEPIKDEASLRAWASRGDDKPIPLLLKGQLHVTEGAESKDLPFSRAGELRAPRLPVPKMDDAEVARYEGGDLGISFFLGLENQNAFPVHVKSVTYTAKLAGRQVADGIATAGDKLPPSQISEYEVDAKLERDQGGADVTKQAESGPLPYEFDGEADFGITKVPIHLTGSLTFGKKSDGHHAPKPAEGGDAPKPADDQ